MPINFKLRFPLDKIEYWSSRYEIDDAERVIETDLVPKIKADKCLNRDSFLRVCYWKTPRSKQLCEQNDTDTIAKLTEQSLTASDEHARVRALLQLRGVAYPTASVILHWFHEDPYPIVDVRALESLSVNAPNNYTFDFWSQYTSFCRGLATGTGCSMRTVDRALWQFSKEMNK